MGKITLAILIGMLIGTFMRGLDMEFSIKLNNLNKKDAELKTSPTAAFPLSEIQLPTYSITKENPNLKCPHSRFIKKHLCSNCSSVEDALAYSEARVLFAPTGTNGVLFGTSENAAWTPIPIPNEDAYLCQNKEGMRHYTCKMKTKQCKLDGENCFTWHYTTNGHLFYKETMCTDTGFNLNKSTKKGEVNNAMTSMFGEEWQSKFVKANVGKAIKD